MCYALGYICGVCSHGVYNITNPCFRYINNCVRICDVDLLLCTCSKCSDSVCCYSFMICCVGYYDGCIQYRVNPTNIPIDSSVGSIDK
jgi:hypothetical protein